MSQRVRQSVSPGHTSYQVTGCFVKVPLPPTPFSYRRERERKVETKEIHLGQALPILLESFLLSDLVFSGKI